MKPFRSAMAYSVGMGLLKTRYVFILMPDERRAEHCTAHSGGPHKRHGQPQACSSAGTSWRRGATARGGKRGSGHNGDGSMRGNFGDPPGNVAPHATGLLSEAAPRPLLLRARSTRSSGYPEARCVRVDPDSFTPAPAVAHRARRAAESTAERRASTRCSHRRPVWRRGAG